MNTTANRCRPLCLWAFTDNKPGHRNQLEGLLNALAERRPIECRWIVLDKPFSLTLAALKDYYRHQRPDLLLGAGHRTHKYLLLGRLLTGGKTIVLMKPSVPLSWFDLALIPAHDGDFNRHNIITTEGAINKIRPSENLDPAQGLFLIGGPSRHYDWDNASVAQQIACLVSVHPDIAWTLTTSRRTPADFIAHLMPCQNLIKCVPHTETDSHWLPRQLSISGQVWVTEDSVSMIYEALTSGACTGLLEIPGAKGGRVRRGIEQLLATNRLGRYSDWLKNHILTPSAPLHEAQRCADLILKYFNYAQ